MKATSLAWVLIVLAVVVGLIALIAACGPTPLQVPPRPASTAVTVPPRARPPAYGDKIVYDPTPAESTTASVRAAQGVVEALGIDAGSP